MRVECRPGTGSRIVFVVYEFDGTGQIGIEPGKSESGAGGKEFPVLLVHDGESPMRCTDVYSFRWEAISVSARFSDGAFCSSGSAGSLKESLSSKREPIVISMASHIFFSVAIEGDISALSTWLMVLDVQSGQFSKVRYFHIMAGALSSDSSP